MYISTFFKQSKIVTNILIWINIWCEVGGRGQKFRISAGRWLFFFWILTFAFETQVHEVIFGNDTRTYQLVIKSLQCFFWVQCRIYTTSVKREFMDGWDGWVLDGMDGWRIKTVLQLSVHFFCIWNIKITTYIYIYLLKSCGQHFMGAKI